MIPTIRQFAQALLTPDLSFATLGEARAQRDATGMPRLTRTTGFAEARICWEGSEWLLFLPLTTAFLFRAHRTAAHLSCCRSHLISGYRILSREMRWSDACGHPQQSDLIIQPLPAGTGFQEAVELYKGATLIAALDRLEEEMRRIGFVHGNIKPENLQWSHGQFHLLRSHDAVTGTPDSPFIQPLLQREHTAYEALRRVIREEGNPCREDSATVGGPTRRSGTKQAALFEERSIIEQNGLYGYADSNGEVVIPAQFRWAGNFHEDRAEVETDTGMGLIDRTGRYILPPEFEIVDYHSTESIIFARKEGLWAKFDYLGRRISDYSEEHPI